MQEIDESLSSINFERNLANAGNNREAAEKIIQKYTDVANKIQDPEAQNLVKSYLEHFKIK